MQNITSFSTTNQKGQLVLPSAIRKALNISPQVLLQISLQGQVISISPITEVVTLDQAENSYLDILHQTQGAWKDEPETDMTAKRQLELTASKLRKQAW